MCVCVCVSITKFDWQMIHIPKQYFVLPPWFVRFTDHVPRAKPRKVSTELGIFDDFLHNRSPEPRLGALSEVMAVDQSWMSLLVLEPMVAYGPLPSEPMRKIVSSDPPMFGRSFILVLQL